MRGSRILFPDGGGGGLRDICLIGGLGHFFGYFLCSFKKLKFSRPSTPTPRSIVYDPRSRRAKKRKKGDRSSHCPRSIEEENSFYD